MGERNYVNVNLGAELAHLLGKLHNLFSGTLGGIGEGLEMERLNLKATLRHHASCNGGVDTARKKEKSTACATERKTACTGLLPCSYVCVIVSYLNGNGNVGIMNVNLNTTNGGKDHAADLTGDLGRAERKALVTSLGINLKGALACKLLGQIFSGHSHDAVHILLTNGGTVNTNDAKYLLRRLIHTVHVAHIVHGLNVYCRLLEINLKHTVRAGSASKLLNKLGLKALAICTLKHNLTEFTKYNFLNNHFIYP